MRWTDARRHHRPTHHPNGVKAIGLRRGGVGYPGRRQACALALDVSGSEIRYMANVLVLAERLDDGYATPCPPPAFTSGLVSRPRLVERLLDPLGPPLALVTAPAGYGKTTVLAEWSVRDPRGVTWIALDRAHDDDPSLLAAEIATAVDRPGPFALVLDDVQVLQS